MDQEVPVPIQLDRSPQQVQELSDTVSKNHLLHRRVILPNSGVIQTLPAISS